MPLKILHFAPDMSKGNSLRDTIHQILSSLGNMADVHLVTLSPVPSDLSGNYTCHCIGNGKDDYGRHGFYNLLAVQKRFLVILYDLMPDVVHIHGSYSFISSRMELWSRKRGFPVIFSPYAGMNPQFIDAEYGMRTWKMILYQRNMVQRASAIQVSDKDECDYLRNEGLSRRVVYIEAPYTEEDLAPDYEDYTTRLHILYRKVLETRAYHLDVRSSEAVSALLHLSLSDEQERRPLTAEDILNLRSLSPAQWHAIQLYAHEHDILPLIVQGAKRMQMGTNLDENFWCDTFPPLHEREKGHLPTDKLLSNHRRHLRMIGNITLGSEYTIRKLCFLLENIKHHLSQHTLTLRHLCDLYEVFRYEDMDEPRLKEVLNRLHLHHFCRRLCQVLSEATYLDEGFMPVPTLNDSGTEKIRQALAVY